LYRGFDVFTAVTMKTTTSYFSFSGEFYGQIDGVAMGSSLSLVIANLYMEDFERAALDSAPPKPLCWFCCG
jgi:hypothetical protein